MWITARYGRCSRLARLIRGDVDPRYWKADFAIRQVPTDQAFNNSEFYYTLLADLPNIVLGTVAFVFGLGVVAHIVKLHKGRSNAMITCDERDTG